MNSRESVAEAVCRMSVAISRVGRARRQIRRPNVRAKLAPTVGRQGQVGDNVQRTADLALVTRCWGSA